jgi:hypothetical protein
MKNGINIKPKLAGAIEPVNPGETSLWARWHALEDTQAKRKTMWFTLSLIVQGIFLPIPAYLIFYEHAPVFLEVLSVLLYFSNMIGGMGGDSIRVTISIFVISVLTHLTMLLVYC